MRRTEIVLANFESSYNRIEVQYRFGKDTRLVRFVALACFFVLLLTSFAGSIHTHASAQDSTCLICHASDENANTVPIASDAGKLHLSSSGRLDTPAEQVWVSETLPLARSPRAPPQSFLVR
jgi:hypothetical protein